jgi:hypothetical protein
LSPFGAKRFQHQPDAEAYSPSDRLWHDCGTIETPSTRKRLET